MPSPPLLESTVSRPPPVSIRSARCLGADQHVVVTRPGDAVEADESVLPQSARPALTQVHVHAPRGVLIPDARGLVGYVALGPVFGRRNRSPGRRRGRRRPRRPGWCRHPRPSRPCRTRRRPPPCRLPPDPRSRRACGFPRCSSSPGVAMMVAARAKQRSTTGCAGSVLVEGLFGAGVVTTLLLRRPPGESLWPTSDDVRDVQLSQLHARARATAARVSSQTTPASSVSSRKSCACSEWRSCPQCRHEAPSTSPYRPLP